MRRSINITILVVLGLVLVAMALWDRRAYFISGYLSKTVDMSLSMEQLDISRSGFVAKEVKIYNPPGSSLETAFSTPEVAVTMASGMVFQSNVVVRSVVIKDAVIGIEIGSEDNSDNNWKDIIERPVSNEKTGKTYHVDSVVFENVRARIMRRGQGGGIQEIFVTDRLVLKDLESSSTAGLRDILVKALATAVEEAARKGGLGDLIQTIGPDRLVPILISPMKIFP